MNWSKHSIKKLEQQNWEKIRYSPCLWLLSSNSLSPWLEMTLRSLKKVFSLSLQLGFPQYISTKITMFTCRLYNLFAGGTPKWRLWKRDVRTTPTEMGLYAYGTQSWLNLLTPVYGFLYLYIYALFFSALCNECWGLYSSCSAVMSLISHLLNTTQPWCLTSMMHPIVYLLQS